MELIMTVDKINELFTVKENIKFLTPIEEPGTKSTNYILLMENFEDNKILNFQTHQSIMVSANQNRNPSSHKWIPIKPANFAKHELKIDKNE